MKKTLRSLAMLAGAIALLAAPAAASAHHRASHSKGPKGGQHKSQSCKKPANKVGFVVRGTLTSFTTDNPATPANEASATISVTGANRHARNSGELQDTDPGTPGTQVQGGAFTVNASADPFKVQLGDFETGETPSAGDPVRIVGKVARTREKCAPTGTSLADRYGAVNIRKVVVHDAD